MTKDAPAFDFFPERWTHGTRHMTKVERCDYLDLLCTQWTDDGLPADVEMIARILGYKKAAQVPPTVIAKFPLAEDGKRRNRLLETIREKQRERIIKSRNKIARMNEARSSTRGSTRPSTRGSTSGSCRLPHPSPITPHQRIPSESPPTPEPPAPPSLVLEPEANGNPAKKPFEPNELQLRVASWFNRRPTTPWSDKDRKAWKVANPLVEDVELMACYYTARIPSGQDFRRRDMVTLLNNWSGELDRARKHVAENLPQTGQKQGGLWDGTQFAKS